MLARLFGPVLVASCMWAQLWPAPGLSLRLRSACPALLRGTQLPPSSRSARGGGGGAPLPEVLSEGTGLPSQFPPSFCSQNDKRPGSLSSSLFASTPKLWASVFICECVTQQGQDVCLSLLSDWLTSRSLQRLWRLVSPKTRTSPQVGGLRGRW